MPLSAAPEAAFYTAHLRGLSHGQPRRTRTASNGTSCALDAFPAQDAALRDLLGANGLGSGLPSCLCDFAGVECSVDAGVWALDLGNRGLSVLPPSIGALSALRELDLSTNSLSSLPAEAGLLPKLTVLRLSSNKLQALPESIGRLGNLTTLLINSNRLTAVPASLGALTQLALLDLGANQLQSLPDALSGLAALNISLLSANRFTSVPPCVIQWRALASLDLSSNRISALPDDLANLSGLHALYLFSNQLRALPDTMRSLTRLELLFLYDNSFAALPAWIGELSALRIFSVSSNVVSELPASFGNLSSLEETFLYANNFSVLPDEIGGLRSLQRLHIYSNAIRALPASMAQLGNLTELYVYSNAISELPSWIGQISSLERLDVSDNFLSALPSELGQLHGLESLLVHSNKLSALPAAIGQLVSLRILDLHNNSLTALPAEIGSLHSLLKFDPSQNQLTDVPETLRNATQLVSLNLSVNLLREFPAWLCQVCHLRQVDLSFNRIVSLLSRGNMSQCCGERASLEAVSFRGNELGPAIGLCDVLVMLFTAFNRHIMNSLDMRSTRLNSLSVLEPCLINPVLTMLDLSSNRIDFFDMWVTRITMRNVPGSVLDMRNNSLLKFSPSLLTPGTDRVFLEPFFCSTTLLSRTDINLLVDPSQRNYLYCSCAASDGEPMLWSPGQGLCVNMRSSQVIFDAAIVSDALRLSIAPGFYPLLAEPGFVPGDWRAFLTSASLNNSLRVVPCRLADACSSSNVPSSLPLPANYSFHFECGAGRDPASLMCSRCMTGYFSTGATCTRCFKGAAAVAVLAFMMVSALGLFLLWRFAHRANSALFAICFFYLQASEALEQSFINSNSIVSTLPTQLIAMLYLRPFALECIVEGADDVTAMWAWFIVLLAIPLVAVGMGFVAFACRGKGIGSEGIIRRVSASTWQLYSLVYLPVARASLSAFTRESVGDSPAFVSSAPYLQWDSPRRREWTMVATLVLVFFLIPFLLAEFARAYMVRSRFARDGVVPDEELPATMRVLRDPRILWWWAPVVVDGRRFFFAALVSLSPWRSEWLPIVAVLALLVLLIAAVVYRPYRIGSEQHPWRADDENLVEALLLFTALILFTGQLSSELTSVKASSGNVFIATCILLAKAAVVMRIVWQVANVCSKLRRNFVAAQDDDSGANMELPGADPLPYHKLSGEEARENHT